MSGDAASRNEDELLSQIDELKARMDRLKSGGSSTSNSALLTDKPEATPPPPPVTDRTRVRDLMDSADTEVIEVYPGPKEVVPFPDKLKDQRSEVRAVDPPVARPEPRSGSVISVEEEPDERRPQVATFDDLGSAIQHELERDGSIPPAEARKGPDLASRFGPVEDTAKPTPVDVETAVADEPAATPAEAVDEIAEVAEEAILGPDELDSEERSSFGKVAAIWAFTAILSGVIATLHFTGII